MAADSSCIFNLINSPVFRSGVVLTDAIIISSCCVLNSSAGMYRLSPSLKNLLVRTRSSFSGVTSSFAECSGLEAASLFSTSFTLKPILVS